MGLFINHWYGRQSDKTWRLIRHLFQAVNYWHLVRSVWSGHISHKQSREIMTPVWVPWTKLLCVWIIEIFYFQLLEYKTFPVVSEVTFLPWILYPQSNNNIRSSFSNIVWNFPPYVRFSFLLKEKASIPSRENKLQ